MAADNAVPTDPKGSATTILERAISDHRAGHLPAAEAAYRAVLSADPSNPDALHLLGVACFQQDRLQEAETLIRQAIACNPSHAGAQNSLGNMLLESGRTPQAIAAYRIAVALKPSNPEGHGNLGTALLRSGQPDAAITAFSKAIGLRPDHPPYLLARARALAKIGRPMEAIADYRQARDLKPDDADIVYELARAHEAVGDFEAAEASFRDAATLLGEHASLEEWLDQLRAKKLTIAAESYRRGINYHSTGDFGAAAEAYRHALSLRPDFPEAHANLADAILRSDGSPNDALNHSERALSLHPGAAIAAHNRGRSLQRLGRLAEAEAALRHAHALDPNRTGSLNDLGNILSAMGRLEEAAGLFEQALRLDPQDPDLHTNLGATLLELDRPLEAEAQHRQALAIAPDLAAAWNNLGHTLELLGRLPEASAALERALELLPQDGNVIGNLAILHWRCQRFDEAARGFERALSIDPGNGYVRYNAGMFRLGRGQLDAGWLDYGHRFTSRGYKARKLPAPRWNGGPTNGRRLLVWREQGIGDEIMFASCLPDALAGLDIIGFECTERLLGLFRRSFPALAVDAETVRADGVEARPRDQYDCHAPIGDLASAVRSSLARFPGVSSFLVPDPTLTSIWRQRLEALGIGLKVGICWRSSVVTTERSRAYTNLNDWGELLQLNGVHFVNLQYDDCSAELQVTESTFGVRITTWSDCDLHDDLETTTALIANLDLVITAPTSVGELAGALGVPVWRLQGSDDWTTLGTSVRPWYASVYPMVRKPSESVSRFFHRIVQNLKHLAESQPSPADSATISANDLAPAVTEAIQRVRAGRRAEARSCYTTILQTDPLHSEANRGLASLLRADGDWAAAADRLRVVATAHPDRADIAAELAGAYAAGGQFADAESWYRKAMASEPGNASHAYNAALMREKLGDRASAEQALRIAIALDPDHGRSHSALAGLLVASGRPEEAEDHNRAALSVRPNDPDFLVNLAVTLHALERFSEAAAACRRALDQAPTHILALVHLGSAQSMMGQAEAAEAAYSQALAIDPENPEALSNLGLLRHRAARRREALDLFDAALRRQPNHALSRYNRGLLLLENGQLSNGWADYEHRFAVPGSGARHRPWPIPAWRGEPLRADGRLFIWPEQGLGDEILFAASFPALLGRGLKLVVECDSRLVSIFQRSFPDAVICPVGSPHGPFSPDDRHCPAGSLNRYNTRSLADLSKGRPFLHPDPDRQQAASSWLDSLEPGLRVGICWRSSLLTAARRSEYASLDEWSAILATQGVIWINLQYDECDEEIRGVAQRFGIHIHRHPTLDLRDDIEGTATLMASLDLVVSAPTATAELSSALGVPTWRIERTGGWARLGTCVRPPFPAARPFRTGPSRTLPTVLAQAAQVLIRHSRPASPI